MLTRPDLVKIVDTFNNVDCYWSRRQLLYDMSVELLFNGLHYIIPINGLCSVLCSVLCWITLQSLPATYEMAFAGNRNELTNKLQVSFGLLHKLLDNQIINRRQYDVIQVLHTCFWLLRCLLKIFIYWQNFYLFYYTLIFQQEFCHQTCCIVDIKMHFFTEFFVRKIN